MLNLAVHIVTTGRQRVNPYVIKISQDVSHISELLPVRARPVTPCCQQLLMSGVMRRKRKLRLRVACSVWRGHMLAHAHPHPLYLQIPSDKTARCKRTAGSCLHRTNGCLKKAYLPTTILQFIQTTYVQCNIEARSRNHCCRGKQ